MKRAVRILTFLLCVLLLTSAMICVIAAAESDTLGQQLSTLMENYYAQIHTPETGDDPGDVVLSYFNSYWEYGNSEEEKQLLYHQGVSAGLLTWIYYMDPSLHEVEAVTNTYYAQWAKIDPVKFDDTQSAPSLEFFEETNGVAQVDDCYTALLTAVYTAKLQQLQAKVPDVVGSTVPVLVASAINELNTMNFRSDFKAYNDTENVDYSKTDDYEKLLDATTVAVTDQREREATAEQLRQVYITLFDQPSDFMLDSVRESDEVVDGFLTKLMGDPSQEPAIEPLTEIKDMNLTLREALVTLLEQLSEGKASYELYYFESLISSVQYETNKDATPADVVQYFSDYEDKLARAQYKDRLVAYEAGLSDAADGAKRDQLVAEYTTDDPTTPQANDAIFDTCDPENLPAQLERAKHRILLYNSYVDTLNQIKNQVGTTGKPGYDDADLTDLTGEAEEILAQTDLALKSSGDPEADLLDGEAALTALVLEATARAFENSHADVLNPNQSPTKDALKQAIEDASLLSPEVIAILQARTEDDGTTPAPVLTAIGERYKDLLQKEIADALAGEDNASIREESITTLQTAIENLELTSGDTDLTDLKRLPSAADALLEKAQKIDRVLDHYHTEIDDSVKSNDMVAFCDTAAERIISGTTTPEDAIIELNRMEAKAKILQAAEGATEVPGVQELLDGVDAELAQLSDPDEIEEYQNHVTNQINSCKDAKEQIDKLVDAIEALTHATDEQKNEWKDAIQEAYENYLTEIAEATNGSEIGTAEETLSTDLLAILKNAVKEEIEKATRAETDTVNGYTYIDETKKQDFLDQLADEKQNVLTEMDQAATDTPDEIFELLTDLLDKLEQITADADEQERKACFDATEKSLEKSYTPSDYSTERQNELLGIVHEYSKRLDEENTVAENEAILSEALTNVDAVPNLLEDAQTAAEALLRAAYEKLMLRKHCYSADNLAKLNDFYQRTLTELKQFKTVADTAAATALADERIALMRAIPLDRIYTADGLLANPGTVTAPDGYDPTANGYGGKIETANGLPATATVTVTPADSTGVAERIKEAAKDKRVLLSDGSKASKDLIKLLKNCHVTTALRIEFGGTPLTATKEYTVSVLLPAGTDLSHVIGVVYLNEDGSAEYLAVTSEETLIQFMTTHFSNFYLVSENTVNLMPWIVLLGVIILCEALALALLSLKKRKLDNQATLNSFTLLPIVTALTIYRPTGGVWILSFLIVIAVALAVWLTWLILSLRLAPVKAEAEPIIEEQPKEPEPESIQEELPEKPEPEPIQEELSEEPEPLATVTVEAAVVLMSDDEAKEELAEDSAGYVDPEQYFGTKKAEINIDTISENFQSGDTVTLNSLKEKKLLPKNVGFVKILARGTLDKPLTVLAQDFSVAALKMILLTGGTPIHTHASPEREGTKKSR